MKTMKRKIKTYPPSKKWKKEKKEKENTTKIVPNWEESTTKLEYGTTDSKDKVGRAKN